MDVKIVFQESERKDFKLNSGDLLYNLERDEYFQVIKIDQASLIWIIYNLKNHTYLSNGFCVVGAENDLTYSEAVKRINSRFCGNSKWQYVKREEYGLSININKS